MVDPVSVAALTGVALTEGIKFLYNQADAILKRRAERMRAKQNGTPLPEGPIVVETPAVIEGKLDPLQIDPMAADRLADELKELRRRLDDYAHDYELPPEGDSDVLRATLALRDAVEDIVGQRITFRGEQREASGTPIATGRLVAQQIRGRATALDIDDMTVGTATGVLETDVVESTGEATAARIKRLG